MNAFRLTLVLVLFVILTLVALAFAGVPQTINYQGYLTATGGAPASGPLAMTFSLYSSNPSRNNPVWRETQPEVPVNNGIYSVRLGSVETITAPFDVPYYLGVTVGSDDEMPLQPLSSVPYALRSSLADAVTSNSVGTAAIADSSITTAKIADGAVSDAQISGIISSDKLDLSTVQKKYGKVAVVSQSGGDYTSPVAAMADSNTWCGTPSADNPCLLKIMPGVYDLGAGSLTMQQYIDIEGSGKGSTLIKSAVGNTVAPPAATVVGANSAEIRNLSIRNSGSGNYAAGIINNAASPRVSQIAITVTGSATGNYYGVYNQLATSMAMDDSTVTVSGGDSSYGIYNTSSSASRMSNLTVRASGASIASYGIYMNNSDSPAVSNVTVNASGGISSYAIYNFNSSPSLNNVHGTAAGSSSSYGVHNTNASPVMNNVIAYAEGGTSGYGIYNSAASEPVMVNVDASALYATNAYGMYNSASFGTYMISADRSSFTGATYSIFNDTEFTLKVGASKLAGPTNNLGSYSYLASYSDSANLGAATTGTQTIQTGSDTGKGLVVKANSAGQTANLQEWQKSNGTVAASVSADGVFTGDASGLSNMKYGRTAIVALSGGNYTSPATAMTALASWCGTPSAANPCLLKILPGEYDLGSATLAMQSYVDIEGSGENVTIITSAVASGSSPPTNGTVNGASNAGIRLLSVRNSGGGAYAAGMVNNAGAAPRVTQVSVTATGGTTASYGIYNNASSPVITGVTAGASGGNNNYGIYNNASSPAISGCTANATGGGDAYGVYNMSASRPVMNTVTAIASDATSNHGVYNSGSFPAMNGIIASATGGSFSYGVRNSLSSPVMNNVTSYASATGGGSSSYGVYNQESSPAMNNVIAEATGATNTYGLYNIANTIEYTIIIDRCSFSGATNSIRNDAEYTLRIGASKLAGPVNEMGSYLYLASYSDTAALGSSTVGTQTIQTDADTGKGLIVKGNSATQSANLQEWQDSSGVAVASVSAAGVLTGDGSGLSGVQKKPGRTAVVAKSGGDYTSPVTAMNGRDSWCSAPSPSSPCLLKIMPGTYDLGGGTLTMQQYIDIEGSGELATIITSAVGADSIPPAGTVVGASNAEIRFLAIRNTGANLYGAGMVNNNSSPRMKHVSITASGSDTIDYGVYNGNNSSPVMNDINISVTGAGGNAAVHNENSSPIMNSVTASATGAFLGNNAVVCISSAPVISNSTLSASGGLGANGVYVDSSDLTMSNTTVTASSGGIPGDTGNGIYITATAGTHTVTIDRSSVEGNANSILLDDTVDSTYYVLVGGSKLTGPVVGGDGMLDAILCANSYDGSSASYGALNGLCQ